MNSLRAFLLIPILMGAPLLGAGPASANELPVPPLPPDQTPSSTAAPIPDGAVIGPTVASAGPTVALRFYRAQTYDPGLGFAPGSRYRTAEDRKPIQTPGIAVTLPIP